MIIQGWDWVIVWLLILAVILETLLHGKERTGKYNAISGLIRNSVTFWLLYMGGMFK